MKKAKTKKNKSRRITEEIFKKISQKLEDVFDTFFVEPNKKSGPPPPLDVSMELLRNMLESDWAERQISNAIYYLKNKGYLIRKKLSGQDKYFLSNKGLEKILKLKIEEQFSKKLKKFKDKYLVVIFDIPVKEKRKRALLRQILRRLKFEKLQQSVWITKFDVLKEVKVLVRFYKLEPYVRFMFVREAEKEI